MIDRSPLKKAPENGLPGGIGRRRNVVAAGGQIDRRWRRISSETIKKALGNGSPERH